MAVGCAVLYHGQARSAHEHLKKALRHYDPEYARDMIALAGWDTGVISRCYDTQALWFIGFTAQAEESADRARALASDLENPFNVALCHGLLSLYYAYSNEPAKLLETTKAGMRVSADGGFLHWLALTTLLHGSALCKTGKTAEGISLLNEGIQQWRSTGAKLGLPLYLGLRAHAWMTHGKIKNAAESLAEALSISARNDDCHFDAELYRLQGELALAACGQRGKESSEGSFRRAIKIAQSQKSKTLELRAITSLCRLWLDRRKQKQAREKLKAAYGRFTEGFDTPDLKQAKALLDELS
jgi:tetratricopeptide (TPR) repeat protein